MKAFAVQQKATAAMNEIVVNIVLVLVFVLIGGGFAATEIALVSLREGQIRRLER